MTVEADSEINASNPRGISLTIANTGLIQLRNVQPAFGLVSMVMGPPFPNGQYPGPEYNATRPPKFAFKNWFAKALASDERYEIRVDASSPQAADGAFYFTPGGRLARLDFLLIINYNPWIFPIRCEKEFRFVTRQEPNGMLSLMPRPIYR